MLACISPTFSSANHSINTLRYSDRLKEKPKISHNGIQAINYNKEVLNSIVDNLSIPVDGQISSSNSNKNNNEIKLVKKKSEKPEKIIEKPDKGSVTPKNEKLPIKKQIENDSKPQVHGQAGQIQGRNIKTARKDSKIQEKDQKLLKEENKENHKQLLNKKIKNNETSENNFSDIEDEEININKYIQRNKKSNFS
jgi:kinesin family protein 2/24